MTFDDFFFKMSQANSSALFNKYQDLSLTERCEAVLAHFCSRMRIAGLILVSSRENSAPDFNIKTVLAELIDEVNAMTRIEPMYQ